MKKTLKPTYLNQSFKALLLTLCVISGISSSALALDLNLAWDANNDQSVAGYKLYYQPNSRNLSIGSNETIPVDVGDQTSATLSGLSDNQVYYFAVSAYDHSGNESSLSDVIASGWTPSLIAPEQGTNQAGASYVTFVWDTPPSNYPVSYTLYYGTDPQLNSAMLPATKPFTSNDTPVSVLLVVLAVGFLIFGRKRLKLNLAIATSLMLGLVATGCGSGGGNLATGESVITTGAAQTETTAVVVGKSDYHEVYDLKAATTYYWKVVAVDDTNPGLMYESETFTFTN